MSKPGDSSRARAVSAAKARARFIVEPPARTTLIRPPADWDFPRRTLMIVGLPRSGTTYLCKLMASTGVLGHPDEFFIPERALRYDARRGSDLAFRLTLPNTVGRSDNGVAAVKAFSYNFDEFARRTNLQDFYPDPVFIYMRRRDVLGQAVSFARALQSGEWTSQDVVQHEPQYSADAVHGALMELVYNEARWNAYFARNNVQPLEVFYEDLLGNEESVLREIARRAGLDEAEGRITFVPPDLSVQRDALNADWRARFIAERADVGWLEQPCRRKRVKRKPKNFIRLLLGKLYV
jgi:LPS sulfotransferase NodH